VSGQLHAPAALAAVRIEWQGRYAQSRYGCGDEGRTTCSCLFMQPLASQFSDNFINSYFSPDIVRAIKSRKIRWSGHVASGRRITSKKDTILETQA
jgi:hypothetical protein